MQESEQSQVVVRERKRPGRKAGTLGGYIPPENRPVKIHGTVSPSVYRWLDSQSDNISATIRDILHAAYNLQKVYLPETEANTNNLENTFSKQLPPTE